MCDLESRKYCIFCHCLLKSKISKKNNNSYKNGIFCLKGGDLDQELKESKRKYKVYPIPDFFQEDFFETKKVIHWVS